MSNNQQDLACNLGAIDPAQRETHEATSDHVFASVLEIKESAEGYAFRLPSDTPMLYKAVEFVANERLCCPFFTFNLRVADGQVWLELSGTPEVKDIIEAGIVTPIRETGAFSPILKDAAKAGTPLREVVTLLERKADAD